MTKAIVYISTLLITLNLIFGAIISSYGWFNITASSIVIILTAIYCLLANIPSVRGGFKVSLLLLYPLAGVVQLFIVLFMPSQFTDNWELIAILLIAGIEAFLLITALLTSKAVKQ